MKQVYVLTGATSGLGLETAKQLALKNQDTILLVGARNPQSASSLRQAVPEAQLWVGELDTSSLSSVRAFAETVISKLPDRPISGMALNAGVQVISGTKVSVDGFELTFATNVLGHIALFNALLEQTSPSTNIVSTASGTHDGANRLATSYGFRGGFFPSAEAVAKGDVSDARDKVQQGLDRYATSKLCNILFTYAMARKFGPNGPRFIAFDPGLMPGTDLARDRSKVMQFAWKNILPVATRGAAGVSSAPKSGAVLAELLQGIEASVGTGLHVEFTRQQIKSSELSYSVSAQDSLIEFAADQVNK